MGLGRLIFSVHTRAMHACVPSVPYWLRVCSNSQFSVKQIFHLAYRSSHHAMRTCFVVLHMFPLRHEMQRSESLYWLYLFQFIRSKQIGWGKSVLFPCNFLKFILLGLDNGRNQLSVSGVLWVLTSSLSPFSQNLGRESHGQDLPCQLTLVRKSLCNTQGRPCTPFKHTGALLCFPFLEQKVHNCSCCWFFFPYIELKSVISKLICTFQSRVCLKEQQQRASPFLFLQVSSR